MGEREAGTPLADSELAGVGGDDGLGVLTEPSAAIASSMSAENPFTAFHTIEEPAEPATPEPKADSEPVAKPDAKAAPGVSADPAAKPDASEAEIARVLDEARAGGKDPNAALKAHLKTVLDERQPAAADLTEYGGEPVVKAATSFYQTFMNPAEPIREAYNQLAKADGERMVGMWEVAASIPANRDIFAKLATGNYDVDAGQLAALAEVAAVAPVERIMSALHVLEQVEAGADLDDLEFERPTGAEKPAENPELAELRAKFEQIQLEKEQADAKAIREELTERRKGFERTLETPIDDVLTSAALTDIDKAFREASGLPFGLTEMVKNHVQSLLVHDKTYGPKFNAALHHSLRPDGQDAANAFLPSLLTGAKNLTTSVVEGINAVARAARARKGEVIAEIEGEPRLSGSTSSEAFDDPTAKFAARVGAGENPFQALSRL